MEKKKKKSFNLKKIPAFYRKNRDAIKVGVALFVLFFAIIHMRGCVQRSIKHKMPPRPVQTAVASQKDVPLYVDCFGTLSPFNNVDIKSQVTGKIKKIHFQEGQELKKGDPLFTIDPDPYKAEVEKAQAALAEGLVDAKLKKDTHERNKSLYEKELISQQDYEKCEVDALTAKAQVKSDRAVLDLAKINLDYCFINTPVSGVIGKRQVDLGNLVIANGGTTLVNVKTINNLYLDFTIPERELAKVRKAMAATEGEKLKVEIRVAGDEGGPYAGELDSLDNTVDDQTGTVSLRAIVPNEDRKLWAGQFVQVRLILGIEKGAVVVPYQAVQLGQQGSYIFVVTPRNKVDLRPVTTGTRDGSNIVIEKGVEAGEKVVTVGVLALAPGVPVIDLTELQKKEEQKKRK